MYSNLFLVPDTGFPESLKKSASTPEMLALILSVSVSRSEISNVQTTSPAAVSACKLNLSDGIKSHLKMTSFQ